MSLTMATWSAVVTLAMVASLLSWSFLAVIRACLIGLRLGGLAGLTCKDTQRR